jgi:mitochondrial fission protein ELM1
MSLTSTLPPRPPMATARRQDHPYVVTLNARPGVAPSRKPPVRIFLGSQDEQHRAERIFFYSIERVRDPSRVYEIHVMKNLAGFVRRGWRTGFTNYRFAITDFAGRHGKAIYNDVDQIYTADPGHLFDLDLGSHGYLAVSATDTSVMLLDCARMAEWWNQAAARTRTKDQLLAKVKPVPGLWGALDGGWNARDMEFVEGRSNLLHYTAMHTQPWHPFPKDYAYRNHPLGELWYGLERAADAEGYEVFSRSRPSPLFADALALRKQAPTAATSSTMVEPIDALTRSLQIRSALSVDTDPVQEATTAIRGVSVQSFDLTRAAETWPRKTFDAVIANELLERVPGEDVPWVIGQLFESATKLVYVKVACFPTGDVLADGADRRCCVRETGWWRERMAAAAGRHPGIVWRLDAVGRNRRGERSTIAFQSNLAGNKIPAPNTWVLVGPRAGDRSQLLGVADALGWHYEIKELAYNGLHRLPNWLMGSTLASLDRATSTPLVPPWPDLIIDGGKRSVPIARWIRDRSGGQTRWVHVGRSWAPLAEFDLVITTPQYRLPPRPNVLRIDASLHRITAQRLADAAQDWADRLQHLPRPWIALLVGGDSPPYVLDPATAAHLGQRASAHARQAGGTLLVTTSARTQPAAVEALLAAVTEPAYCHRWQRDQRDNPYLAYLALADSFIVTGDSASMLAEACATGKPVALFETPLRPTRLRCALAAIERLITGHGSRKNYRGMPKQQDWLARCFDRMIERGLFMPIRELRDYHHALLSRGLLHRFGETSLQAPPGGSDNMNQAVDAIRRLMAGDRRVQ